MRSCGGPRVGACLQCPIMRDDIFSKAVQLSKKDQSKGTERDMQVQEKRGRLRGMGGYV